MAFVPGPLFQSGGGPCEEGHDFLEKPFALEALARKIREILDRAADPDCGRVAS